MSDVSKTPSWPAAELAQQEWDAIRNTSAPESEKRAKREEWGRLMMLCMHEVGVGV